MAEFIGRWFTGSNSDGSGMVPTGKAGPKPSAPKKKEDPVTRRKTRSRIAPSRSQDEAKVARKTLLGE